MAASDESFGEKEHLLDPEPAAFEPGRYGPRGEIVDGWETRRRRESGHDWALIHLGAPGIISSIDVDTSFFAGNHPESCLIEAAGREGYPDSAALADPATKWVEIVPRSDLRGDAHNDFAVSDRTRFTHLRLSIFPDGGVARLRVYGDVVPDPRTLDGLTIDLASQRFGGAVIASSDDFLTSACNLNRPDTARSMGDGWETRRRRDPGYDWVELRLAFAGRVQQLIVDTSHFRYNASAAIRLLGRSGHGLPLGSSLSWDELLERTELQPDTRHVFPLTTEAAVGYARIEAYPDGGLSRIRLIGRIDPAARQYAGYHWLNSLPADQAQGCLMAAGVAVDAAAEIVAERPLTSQWLTDRGDSPSSQALTAIIDGPKDTA
jgi:allantoicase